MRSSRTGAAAAETKKREREREREEEEGGGWVRFFRNDLDGPENVVMLLLRRHIQWDGFAGTLICAYDLLEYTQVGKE